MQKSVILVSISMAVLASLVLLPDSVHSAKENLGLGSLLSVLSKDQIAKFRMLAKILTAQQILAMADTNKDGRLSLEEVSQHLGKYGVNITVEQMKPFDLNNDGYFSLEEIEALKKALWSV